MAANTIDYSQISTYINDLSQDILRDSINEGQTFKYITPHTGVKTSEYIYHMTSNITPVAGGCATIIATGSDTGFDTTTLTVAKMTLGEGICIDKMEDYWIGFYAKKGSYNQTTPTMFTDVYLADKQARINKSSEFYAWIGSTSGTFSTSYTLTNGFLYSLLVTNAGSVNVAGASYSGAITSANALAVVDDMMYKAYNSVEDILEQDDLLIFCSLGSFRIYVNAWLNANNYHVSADESLDIANYTFKIPLTNVRMVGTIGLKGRKEMVLGSAKNFHYGTDADNDVKTFNSWYENKDRALYYSWNYKLGFAITKPKELIIYKGI